MIGTFLGALGAALLIVPGFLTDIAGLVLLLPPLRRTIAQRVLRRARVNAYAAGAPPGSTGRIIEGEFERRP
ncbi:MAG: FxsA family protein [Gammaproteobacteria bacterium]|nr:FxsA family protein [Gammaproteobacteria bacterium]